MITRLVAPARVVGTDSETGERVVRRLPAGSVVWAENVSRVGNATMNGGGFNATITDLDTGWTGHGAVRDRD